MTNEQIRADWGWTRDIVELAREIMGSLERSAQALPFMSKRRVRAAVTAEHIAEGRRNSLSRCPVALALRDAIPGIVEIEVDCAGVWWRDDRGWAFSLERMPRAVARWIRAFDHGTWPVEPFTFELASAKTGRRQGDGS